jgi:hypothetical protein
VRICFLPIFVGAHSNIPYSHDATAEIWQETYVSAILRSILYSDDPTYWLDAYRRLDPITTPETEVRFLQAAEALFMKGAFLQLMVLFLGMLTLIAAHP